MNEMEVRLGADDAMQGVLQNRAPDTERWHGSHQPCMPTCVTLACRWRAEHDVICSPGGAPNRADGEVHSPGGRGEVKRDPGVC